jgi:hypothetical protein
LGRWEDGLAAFFRKPGGCAAECSSLAGSGCSEPGRSRWPGRHVCTWTGAQYVDRRGRSRGGSAFRGSVVEGVVGSYLPRDGKRCLLCLSLPFAPGPAEDVGPGGVILDAKEGWQGFGVIGRDTEAGLQRIGRVSGRRLFDCSSSSGCLFAVNTKEVWVRLKRGKADLVESPDPADIPNPYPPP